MSVPTLFIDTNILIYAHDLGSGEKHKEAAKLLLRAWNEEVLPVISVQVLQELLVNLLRKLDDADEAIQTMIDYSVSPPRKERMQIFSGRKTSTTVSRSGS